MEICHFGWVEKFPPGLDSKKSILLYFKCISIFSSTGVKLVCIIVYTHIMCMLCLPRLNFCTWS